MEYFKDKKAVPIVSLVFALIVFASVFLGNYFFVGITWAMTGAIMTILFSIIALRAGFIVVKSLFLVAAELSLLVYLAQSYCAVPSHSLASDAALKSLLFLGLGYVIISFGRSLYETLIESYKKAEPIAWSVRKSVSIVLFVAFTGSFLWEIYLVISPIILNLCVYK